MTNLLLAENMLLKEYTKIKKKISANYKELFTYLKNLDEYDKLLENNIVFIDLYNSSANNTILECIIRNTPIIVNKLEAVVEYLGEDYPMYFNDLSEIPELLNKIQDAHDYLKVMDKSEFTMNYFYKKLLTSINYNYIY